MKKLLITDLDGTLIDTFPDLYASALSVLKNSRVRLRSHRRVDARPYAGLGARGLIRWLLDPNERLSEDEEERLSQEMVAIYLENLTRESRPFSGTELWFQEFSVAVVTNKPRFLSKPLLDYFFPQEYSLLVTPEDVGEKKPSSLLYQRVISELKQEPLWVIGDDLRDYQATLPLSLPFLIAAYGYYPPSTWDPYPYLPRLRSPAELANFRHAITFHRAPPKNRDGER